MYFIHTLSFFLASVIVAAVPLAWDFDTDPYPSDDSDFLISSSILPEESFPEPVNTLTQEDFLIASDPSYPVIQDPFQYFIDNSKPNPSLEDNTKPDPSLMDPTSGQVKVLIDGDLNTIVPYFPELCSSFRQVTSETVYKATYGNGGLFGKNLQGTVTAWDDRNRVSKCFLPSTWFCCVDPATGSDCFPPSEYFGDKVYGSTGDCQPTLQPRDSSFLSDDSDFLISSSILPEENFPGSAGTSNQQDFFTGSDLLDSDVQDLNLFSDATNPDFGLNSADSNLLDPGPIAFNTGIGTSEAELSSPGDISLGQETPAAESRFHIDGEDLTKIAPAFPTLCSSFTQVYLGGATAGVYQGTYSDGSLSGGDLSGYSTKWYNGYMGSKCSQSTSWFCCLDPTNGKGCFSPAQFFGDHVYVPGGACKQLRSVST